MRAAPGTKAPCPRKPSPISRPPFPDRPLSTWTSFLRTLRRSSCWSSWRSPFSSLLGKTSRVKTPRRNRKTRPTHMITNRPASKFSTSSASMALRQVPQQNRHPGAHHNSSVFLISSSQPARRIQRKQLLLPCPLPGPRRQTSQILSPLEQLNPNRGLFLAQPRLKLSRE